MIDLLKDILKRDEGLRYQAYDDATGKMIERGDIIKGYVSIGCGRNLHYGLSGEEIDFLLNNDFDRCINEAITYPWYNDLNGIRKCVVLSMLFNLGKTRFDTFKLFQKAMVKKDYFLATEEMRQSKWYTDCGDRAERLCVYMMSGVIPDYK